MSRGILSRRKRAGFDDSNDGRPEQVLLVDPLSSRSSLLKRALKENAYSVVEHIVDVTKIVEKTDFYQPDILVVGMDLPDEETLRQLVELRLHQPLPVIVFSEKDTPQMIQKVVKAGVSAFIVDDIQVQRLPSIINIAIARFNEQQGILSELSETKSKLAERKILERAKGLLMAQKGMTEDEAYTSLRKMAMDKGQSIAAVSESIVDVLKLFEK
jgi:response regulator NasT